MTGKDLIMYILENNLENEEIIKNGVFVWFMDVFEAAAKFDVGVETIAIWHSLGWLKGFTVGNCLFFLKDSPDPRKTTKER